MPPKKKVEDVVVPEPEELLPAGYTIDCKVYWTECAEAIGEGGEIVRAGLPGKLVAPGELVEAEDEEGAKSYSLEMAEIHFDGHAGPHKVPLASLALRPPPREAMFSTTPATARTSVDAAPDMEATATSSPFVTGLSTLFAYPRRADKVGHLLEPALQHFLSSTDFEYSSNSFGNHPKQGWVDWRSIYPWTESVLESANAYANLSPALGIDMDVYASLIRKFDKNTGQFISNCPLSENILPFAKFVVTLLYLQSQEEIRYNSEREQYVKTLIEGVDMQGSNPYVSAMWDTDDQWTLQLNITETSEEDGRTIASEFCTGAGGEAEEQPAQTLPLESMAWRAFDPKATGKDAALSPPVGEYRVTLTMRARHAKTPCHWACRVAIGEETKTVFGTWRDGDQPCVEVGVFSYAAPL